MSILKETHWTLDDALGLFGKFLQRKSIIEKDSSFAAYMRNLISVQEKLFSDKARFNQLKKEEEEADRKKSMMTSDPGETEMKQILERLRDYNRELQKIQLEVDGQV